MEDVLKNFRHLTDLEPISSSAIVSGSGDAFTAAITVEEVSNGRFIAMDPSVMVKLNTSLPVILVSASGRTLDTLNVARKFHNRNRVIAVTGNQDSELAKLADITIIIPVESVSMSGTLSFLEMLDVLFRLANIEVKFHDSKTGVVFGRPCFVGSYGNSGIAQFLSLKMAEVFGLSSEHFGVSQFFHAPIFSMREREIVYLSDTPVSVLNESEGELFERVVVSGSNEPLTNAFWGIRSIIRTMRERNVKIPYFLRDKQMLDISSSIIYSHPKR